MNRRGVEAGFVVKLILWVAILLVFAYIIAKYIVGGGGDVMQPGEQLLPLVLSLPERLNRRFSRNI